VKLEASIPVDLMLCHGVIGDQLFWRVVAHLTLTFKPWK